MFYDTFAGNDKCTQHEPSRPKAGLYVLGDYMFFLKDPDSAARAVHKDRVWQKQWYENLFLLDLFLNLLIKEFKLNRRDKSKANVLARILSDFLHLSLYSLKMKAFRNTSLKYYFRLFG